MSIRKRSRRRKPRWAVRTSIVDFLVELFTSPVGKTLLAIFLIAAIGGGLWFNHIWWKHARVVDAKLVGGPFNRTARILAAPSPVFVGEENSSETIATRLREAGYSESAHNQVGWYRVKDDSLEVHPGPLSYFSQEAAVLYFEGGEVSRMYSLVDNSPITRYQLEPELVTNLFDDERSKRRIFKYEDFPPHLIEAVMAIEDHRFFDHHGIDLIRASKAAFDGLVEWRQPRGTSTLTQQLARNFFLTPEQTPQRKAAEILIAFQLELRLSKEEIFEHYANQIFMGRSGSFNVMGMGEAARAYFDKDIRDVTLVEAALLAGLPQGPSYLNPYRHPERAKARRNQVLDAMERSGFIDELTLAEASEAEIVLARGHVESSAAPYYVDLVNSHLRETFASDDLNTQDYWIYTTLDKELQRIAVEAVRFGMELVDERIAKQKRFKGKEPPRAQAALVALDPRTGEVKAVVGGRDYGKSQLNRALAKRQPGSVFKPFVYAAAIDTALDYERVDQPGAYMPGEVFTTATMVDDVPTTFWYDEKPYEPANHTNKIYGLISFREALRKSINVATVKVAELASYERVADLAEKVGFEDIMPTPSIALGAYEATPLQVAGAYTALVNNGVMKRPYFVRLVRDSAGSTLQENHTEEVEALDPRVAYIVTNMLEDVLRRGTGVAARYKFKFEEPAAGKTGTDDDGWFAGYTNNLLCVVWVGFDDNTDLSLEGAHSALPIWAEFMRQAHELRPYRNPGRFEAPEGVVAVEVDPLTQELATYACSKRVSEVFVAGSQPSRFCSLHGGGHRVDMATAVAGWDLGDDEEDEPLDEPIVATVRPPAGVAAAPLRSAQPDPIVLGARTSLDPPVPPPAKKKRGGLFGRVLDVFR